MEVSPLQIDAMRRFNRFYTRFVGALSESFLQTDYPLAPMRVIYAIGSGEAASPAAADVARVLGMDKAQMSRLVTRLEEDGLLTRRADPDHARRQELALTPVGQALFHRMEDTQIRLTEGHLAGLAPADRTRLTGAMATVESLLTAPVAETVTLRAPRPGDLGWVVSAQSRLYAREYGWNAEYEALAMKILADFAEQAPKNDRMRGWIAEVGGVPAGAAFLVERSPRVAQLRLLHVDAAARGHGIGGRLVDACMSFAKEAGYRRIELWTNDVLSAARQLYVSRGFTLIDEAPHHSFGKDLNGQNWGCDL